MATGTVGLRRTNKQTHQHPNKQINKQTVDYAKLTNVTPMGEKVAVTINKSTLLLQMNAST